MAGKLAITVWENDWFTVGEAIVKIEKIRGKACRVTIQAPKEIKVLRAKVIERERHNESMQEMQDGDGE